MSIMATAVLAIFALGWLVPLIIGISQLRRHGSGNATGLVLTILGALWALPAIVVIAAVAIYFLSYRSTVQTTEFSPGQGQSTAAIVTSWQGASELKYMRGKERFVSKGQQGRIPVPDGALRLMSYTAYASPDRKGWRGQTMLYEAGPLQMKAGEQQSLAVGPPYAARVKVVGPPAKPSLSLECKDASGKSASLTDSGGSAPGFEVLDASGKVVWQNKFAYG